MINSDKKYWIPARGHLNPQLLLKESSGVWYNESLDLRDYCCNCLFVKYVDQNNNNRTAPALASDKNEDPAPLDPAPAASSSILLISPRRFEITVTREKVMNSTPNPFKKLKLCRLWQASLPECFLQDMVCSRLL